MSGSIGDNVYRASGVVASSAAAGGLTLDSNFFISVTELYNISLFDII